MLIMNRKLPNYHSLNENRTQEINSLKSEGQAHLHPRDLGELSRAAWSLLANIFIAVKLEVAPSDWKHKLSHLFKEKKKEKNPRNYRHVNLLSPGVSKASK